MSPACIEINYAAVGLEEETVSPEELLAAIVECRTTTVTLMVNESEGWVQSLEYGIDESGIRQTTATVRPIVGDETAAKIVGWFDDRYPGAVHVFHCRRVER